MMKTQEKTPEIRESVQIPAVKQAGADITKEEQNRKDENRKELGCRKIFCRDFSFWEGWGQRNWKVKSSRKVTLKLFTVNTKTGKADLFILVF